MKIVFIAGPYFGKGDRKEIEKNIRNAEKYQVALANSQVPFFCSHNHTEHFEEKASAPEEFYRKMDMEILKRCCDAVVALPDWETSNGARAEIKWAQENGLPVFFPKSLDGLTEIINWAKS